MLRVALLLLVAGCAARRAETKTADVLRELSARATEDLQLQAHVEAVGYPVAAATEKPDLPWQFWVLDDAEVNAFSLAPAHVFVTRGLLLHLGSDAELAFVLGHEMGHIVERHDEKKREEEARARTPSFGFGGGWVGALIRVAATVAQQVLAMQYPKQLEMDADRFGFRAATDAGFDGREGLTLFYTYERLGTGAAQGWFASHPAPRDRIAALQEAMAGQVWSGHRVDRAPYLTMLEGAVFGEDPRQGYVDGATFRHPALKFQIALPDGAVHVWKDGVLVSADENGELLRMTISARPPAKQKAFVALLSRQGLTVQLEAKDERTLKHTLDSVRAVEVPLPPATRVHIVTLDGAMTFAQFAETFPSDVPFSSLAALNGHAATDVLVAGTQLKQLRR